MAIFFSPKNKKNLNAFEMHFEFKCIRNAFEMQFKWTIYINFNYFLQTILHIVNYLFLNG